MTVNFRGYLFDDAGDAVNGASVQLFETGTTTQEGSTVTTDSAGLWYFNEADQDRYDVKITSGASIRYRRWDDQISIKEIDVRNNSAAATPAATFTNLYNSASNQVAVFRGANTTRADNDETYLTFELANSAGELTEFARMTVVATDVTNGSEDGQIEFDVMKAGTRTNVWTLTSSADAATSFDMNVDSLTFGAGADTDITLTFDGNSANGVITWMEDEDYFKFSDDILMNSTERINFYDTAIYIYSSTDGQLDLVADTEIQIAATTIDINGAVALNGAITGATNITLNGVLTDGNYTFDTSGNVSGLGTVASGAITSSGIIKTDDATEATSTTDGSLQTDGGLSVVKDAVFGDDVFLLSDSAVFNMGAGNDFTITHDGTTGATLAGSPITVNSTGALTLDSSTDITLDAGGADIFLKDDGTLFGTLTNSSGELVIKSSSSGTTAATFAGADVTFAGAVQIDGNLTVTGTQTVVDTVTMNAANAVVFEGATADAHETTLTIIDPTSDRTIRMPNQDGYLPVLAAASTTQISATPEELNVLDGVTAGTVSASLGVVVDSNKDIGSFRNITLTGELDAATLDISGNADIAGVVTGVTSLLIGGAASQDAGASGVLTQIMGTSYDDTAMAMGAFRNNTGSPTIYSIKSRNTTIGSHTVVADNDNVFVIEANPDDGTDYATAAARFIMEVDDASPATGDIGMAFVWSSMAGGAASLAERMRLSAAGNLEFAAATTVSTGAGDLTLSPASLLKFTTSAALRSDSTFLYLGAGDDATLKYDGTNLLINPKAVGSGFANVTGDLIVDDGVVVGHTAQVAFGNTPEFQVLGTGAADGSMGVGRWMAGTAGPTFYFVKGNHGTIGNATVVDSGDTLGTIIWNAADGSDFTSQAASLSVIVDGTAGSNDTPGRMVFSTTSDGATAPTERMRIDSAGVATFAGNIRVSDGKDVVVGHSATVSTGNGSTLQVLGTGTGDSTVYIGRWSANSSPASLEFIKSRDPAIDDGSHAIVVNGDEIGSINFRVDDGTDFVSVAAHIRAAIDNTNIAANVSPGRLVFSTSSGTANSPTERMRIDSTGNMFLGDTANGEMTTGITINLGASDDEIFTLKSSDVAHGMTTVTETDTFARFKKISDTLGGLQIDGYSDGGAFGLYLKGVGVTDNTAKTTSAQAPVLIETQQKDGDDVGVIGSDGNCVVIRSNYVARFIFDTEGSAHADVEWVAYADHDDLALIKDIEQHLLGVESPAGTYSRHMLEETGIIGQDSWHMEDGKPRAMINTTKLQMLHHGALMQVGGRLAELEEKLALAESKLAAIGA